MRAHRTGNSSIVGHLLVTVLLLALPGALLYHVLKNSLDKHLWKPTQCELLDCQATPIATEKGYYEVKAQLQYQLDRLQAFTGYRKIQLVIFDEWMRDSVSLQEARPLLDFIDDRLGRMACLFIAQVLVTS